MSWSTSSAIWRCSIIRAASGGWWRLRVPTGGTSGTGCASTAPKSGITGRGSRVSAWERPVCAAAHGEPPAAMGMLTRLRSDGDRQGETARDHDSTRDGSAVAEADDSPTLPRRADYKPTGVDKDP